MKKSSGSVRQARNPARTTIVSAALVLVIVVGLAFIYWPQSSTVPPREQTQQNESSPGASDETKPNARIILGKWLREDGGYVLEFSEVEDNGRLRAAYFNPSPINVSYAAVTNEGNTLKARVELNDVGYPGCYYSLVHDRQNDRLIGTYYQAAMHETFEITFVRVRPSGGIP